MQSTDLYSTEIRWFSTTDMVLKYIRKNPHLVQGHAREFGEKLQETAKLDDVPCFSLFWTLLCPYSTWSNESFSLLDRYFFGWWMSHHELIQDVPENPLRWLLLFFFPRTNQLPRVYENLEDDVRMTAEFYRIVIDCKIDTLYRDEAAEVLSTTIPSLNEIRNAPIGVLLKELEHIPTLTQQVDARRLLILVRELMQVEETQPLRIEILNAFTAAEMVIGPRIDAWKETEDRFRSLFQKKNSGIFESLTQEVLQESPNSLMVFEALMDLVSIYREGSEATLLSVLEQEVLRYPSTVSYPVILEFFSSVLEGSGQLIDPYHYNIAKVAIRQLQQEDRPTQSLLSSSVLETWESPQEALEAFKKASAVINKGEQKIYHAYRTYKNAEEKVDSQIAKAGDGIKKMIMGDVKSEVIEGKKFTPIGLLKQLLGTVAIFSFGPIRAIILLVVRFALKKNMTMSERRKILLELQEELEMVEEKIQDASSDGDREAKYAMMRTRAELKKAVERIRYGLEADSRSVDLAKKTISGIRGGTAHD